MISDPGLTLYFHSDRLRLRYQTILDLQYPQYIHLRINRSKKQMFIQRCEKDMDAFRVIYRKRNSEKDTGIKEQSCHINDRKLLQFLAQVIGVPEDSPSLRFHGRLLPDGETIYIDLSRYEVLLNDTEGESGRVLIED